MSENGEPKDVKAVIAQCIGAAAFLLAGLLFLLVPIAGASCGGDDGPVGVCVSGAQLISGQPRVDMENILTLDFDEFEDTVINTLDLPDWLGTLSLFTLLVLLAGGLASLLTNPRARAAVRLAGALVAAGLVIFIEVRTVSAMTDGVAFMSSLFSYDTVVSAEEAGELVGTESGFWLSLVVLAVIAIVNLVIVSPGARDSQGMDRLSKDWDAAD